MTKSLFARIKPVLFTRVAQSAAQSPGIDTNNGGGDCTSCKLCVSSCPENLDPSKLIAIASLASRPTLSSDTQAERIDDLIENNMDACTACGFCTQACPSNVPLDSLLAAGLRLVRTEQKEKQLSDYWKTRFAARQARMATKTLSRKAKTRDNVTQSKPDTTNPVVDGDQQPNSGSDTPSTGDSTSAFSRSAAQDDIAAAVARVKAKREAKLAAAHDKTRESE